MSVMVKQVINFIEFIECYDFCEFNDEIYCIDGKDVYAICLLKMYDKNSISVELETLTINEFATLINEKKQHVDVLYKKFKSYLKT